MLTDMYKLLLPKFAGRAIWFLLDYIAVTEGFAGDIATPWFSAEQKAGLDRLWSREVYQGTLEDHLGALLVSEHIKVGTKDFVPVLPETARQYVQQMGALNPNVAYEVTPFGTGRIAMELTRAGANAVVGIEETLLLYRIGVVNIYLHALPALVYYRLPGREPNVWNPITKRKTEDDLK